VFTGKAQLNDEKINDKTSLTIGSGITFYSIIDHNISKEKYSGTIVPINFIWTSTFSDKQIRELYFTLQSGSINNYTVETEIDEINLGWDYQYKINKKNKYDIFLGPAPFLYLNNRQQKMPSELYLNSKLGIISLASVFGVRSNSLNRFNYKATARLGILSAAYNSNENEQTKILTPFDGLQFYFSVLGSYKLIDWANVAVQYSFQTYNITAWDKVYSLSDQLMLNLTFSF
jgi:hypothetical protein